MQPIPVNENARTTSYTLPAHQATPLEPLLQGSVAVVGLGYVGIRTDFMDVRFENYRLQNL